MEEFEEIKGFEEYQINRKGEIKGKFGGLLNPSISDGYLNIKLYKDGKKYTKKVHRLLGIQYIPNPDNLPEIDHIDRNRQNNCLENLRWVSAMENSNNRLKRGGIYWNKFDNNWQGQLRFFGKRYTKNSKDKSIVEEWLENIKNKFEIEN